MFVVKAVTILVAGVVSILALRHIMGELKAARVPVRARQPVQPRSATRLRQDPRTGIYYPEE